jgi:hypothetical protein
MNDMMNGYHWGWGMGWVLWIGLAFIALVIGTVYYMRRLRRKKQK